MSSKLSNVAELLARADEPTAARALFALLYADLRKLAQAHLRGRKHGRALGATTLVHEVYMRMVGQSQLGFEDRARFFAYASRAMRAIAVDFARRQAAKKRGRSLVITLQEQLTPDNQMSVEAPIAQLGDALEELGRTEPQLVELIDLHFFGGLSFPEIAALRTKSERTVQREWHRARQLLKDLLHRSDD